MKLLQLLKLSNAEFVTRRKTITFSILAAGVPFIIILMISLVWHGVGKIFLEYSNRPTDGEVYMVLSAEGDTDIMRFVGENRGQLLGEVTKELTAKYETPTTMFAEMAGLSPEQVAMAPGENLIEGREWYEITEVKPLDLILSSVYGYRPPFWDEMVTLQSTLTRGRIILVKFPSLEDAYNYKQMSARRSMYSGRSVHYEEAFTNALDIYTTFQRGSNIPLIIGLVIAGIIMIGTFVYLIDQELHSMVVYRALGASVKDLLVIALGYLIEIAVTMAVFVVLASVVGVLIFSAMNAGYLGGLLEEFYGITSPKTLMLGWSWDILWVVVTILAAVPISLILTLDQFSVRRLSQKLKQG